MNQRHLLFVNLRWLKLNFVDKVCLLPDRQELERFQPQAFSARPGACPELGLRAAISHGWLSKWHPDPCGHRQRCVGQITSHTVFWDFLSLYQWPRTTLQQEISFRTALASMHNVYGNPSIPVYLFVSVPAAAENNTPYHKRGWCMFESRVACTAALSVKTIDAGQFRTDIPSPVPMLPTRFRQELQQCAFANGKTDPFKVYTLYEHIWPRLRAIKSLHVVGWGDRQVDALMAVIHELPNLCAVSMEYSYATPEKERPLLEVLQSRRAGGGVLAKFYKQGVEIQGQLCRAASFSRKLAENWWTRIVPPACHSRQQRPVPVASR